MAARSTVNWGRRSARCWAVCWPMMRSMKKTATIAKALMARPEIWPAEPAMTQPGGAITSSAVK